MSNINPKDNKTFADNGIANKNYWLELWKKTPHPELLKKWELTWQQVKRIEKVLPAPARIPEFNLYAFYGGIAYKGSPLFSISLNDIAQIPQEEYDDSALNVLKSWFEDEIVRSLRIGKGKGVPDVGINDDLSVTGNFDHHYKVRTFEFVFLDVTDDSTIYYVTYSGGSIREHKMWRSFDTFGFQAVIKGLRSWE